MLPGDGDAELSLRPKSLTEFIGQPKVRGQLDLVLGGARARGVVPDHVLLAGPPGLGKTTMAMIIAQELGTSLRMTSGPALERAGDLAAMLSNLMEGDVLFIDEIHRMARPAEEMLYMAMEDFRIDVIVGKGPGATSIPIDLPPFTLVGATTRAGMLTGPLRDRFGFTAQMEFYDTADLTAVVTRAASILGVDITGDAAAEIASRSRGTPRIANRLLRRVRDYADVRADGAITLEVARAALLVFDVDELGLDRLDRAVLGSLVRRPMAADRWVSTPWQWRWGRNPPPSRRCASPTSYVPAWWPVPRVAASPPRRPGGIWGSNRRRRDRVKRVNPTYPSGQRWQSGVADCRTWISFFSHCSSSSSSVFLSSR
jgi:Holliday junction DNA helicase RuvB